MKSSEPWKLLKEPYSTYAKIKATVCRLGGSIQWREGILAPETRQAESWPEKKRFCVQKGQTEAPERTLQEWAARMERRAVRWGG